MQNIPFRKLYGDRRQRQTRSNFKQHSLLGYRQGRVKHIIHVPNREAGDQDYSDDQTCEESEW